MTMQFNTVPRIVHAQCSHFHFNIVHCRFFNVYIEHFLQLPPNTISMYTLKMKQCAHCNKNFRFFKIGRIGYTNALIGRAMYTFVKTSKFSMKKPYVYIGSSNCLIALPHCFPVLQTSYFA